MILSCIEVSRRWLLDNNDRPLAVTEDPGQNFLQQLLKHLSLVFEARKYPDKESVERHARACGKVFSIFLQLAREHGKRLTTETWEIWLKLMLGITDQLFTASPNEEKQEMLAQLLATQVLKTTFEIWLLSGTKNAELWQTLKDLIKNWSTIMATVIQWNATCIGLLNRVLALLYGPAEGTNAVTIIM